MRFHEIASGIPLPVFSEEQELLDRMTDKGMARKDLDERDQEVARLMVSRGVLEVTHIGSAKEHYRPSTVRDIWRDR